MYQKMRTLSQIVLIPLVCAVLIGSSCAWDTDEAAGSEQSDPTDFALSIDAGLYPPDSGSWEAVISNPFNRSIVAGSVVEVGEPRWSTEDQSEPSYLRRDLRARPNAPHETVHFIYSPVRLRVREVIAGDEVGEEIMIRAIGGDVDGVAFNLDFSARLEDLSPEQDVVLFIDSSVVTADGFDGYTPNFVALIDEEQVSLLNGQLDSIALSELRQIAQD